MLILEQINFTANLHRAGNKKSEIKNENDVVIRLSLNMIGDPNFDKTNFPHELLLTSRRVSRFVKHLLKIHRLMLNFQKVNYQK